MHNCDGLPEGYTSAPFNPKDPYSPESVDARIRGNADLYPDAIRSAPVQSTGMIGENGTQITSQTAWLEGSYRIDIENPNPGMRPGQMHFQDQSNIGVKYQWDFENGGFIGMPTRLANQLSNNRGFQAGITKDLNWLGESP